MREVRPRTAGGSIDGCGSGAQAAIRRTALTLVLVISVSAGAAWPPGFPAPLVPADNPPNAAKVELGARLFADGRLSLTGSYSCASCHDPARAFTDGLPGARGATGELHPRNTPTLVNAAYNATLGWLADAPRSLEAQHRVPLFNEDPVELGFGAVAEERLAALRADPGIAALFERAFDAPVATLSLEYVLAAIASYVRTLVYADSPFDRYVYWGEEALSAEARAGLGLFLSERTGCTACHSGFNLSGPVVSEATPDVEATFHDGVRVPTLRNVAVTAPYFHDGSLPTLDAVLDFYATDGHGRPVPLAAAERRALLAFLAALTDGRWRTIASVPLRSNDR